MQQPHIRHVFHAPPHQIHKLTWSPHQHHGTSEGLLITSSHVTIQSHTRQYIISPGNQPHQTRWHRKTTLKRRKAGALQNASRRVAPPTQKKNVRPSVQANTSAAKHFFFAHSLNHAPSNNMTSHHITSHLNTDHMTSSHATFQSHTVQYFISPGHQTTPTEMAPHHHHATAKGWCAQKRSTEEGACHASPTHHCIPPGNQPHRPRSCPFGTIQSSTLYYT